MQACNELSRVYGVSEATRALSIPRASYYRAVGEDDGVRVEAQGRPKSVRALKPEERMAVRDLLNSERFVDHAPREIYATLLDEGKYLSSWRTMYRILAGNAEGVERRQVRRQGKVVKPELVAQRPNEVWSWDITKRWAR